MLKTLYVIAIGLLFAGFVGFGVTTFYKAPTPPECQKPMSISAPNVTPTPAVMDDSKKCDAENKAFQDQSAAYGRNLSMAFLAFSVIIIAISLFGIGKIDVIGDGLTLGGVFILFVGIVTSFDGVNNSVFRFVAITVGLAIILLLSYWKFVRNNTA